MPGRHYWKYHCNPLAENQFSVISEVGLAGGFASLEVGSTFDYTGSDSALSVTDNDNRMAGDAWRNERGTDRQAGTLTTRDGDTIDTGNIYAERYLIVRAADGTEYTLIEIEGTKLSNDPAQDDLFAFYGDVPPLGTSLEVVSSGNVWFGVKYDKLDGGPDAVLLEAMDDALPVVMDAVAMTNLLDNDIGSGAVIATFAGQAVDPSGTPTVITVDGIEYTVTSNGDVTVNPASFAAGVALPDGQTTEVDLTYTISDGTDTSQATLSLTVEGVNDAPELTGLGPVLDGFTGLEQRDGEDYSVDLNDLFTDPDTGDTVTIALDPTSDPLPDGLQIVDGVLGLDGTEVAHGDYSLDIIASDAAGATATETVTFSVGLDQGFGFGFSARTDSTVSGTETGDFLRFGSSAAASGGNLEISTMSGDDIVRFGGSAADRGIGFPTGRVDLDTGDGDDVITFGDRAGGNSGTVLVDAGDGADMVTFGTAVGVGQSGSNIVIDLGDDDDMDTLVFEGRLEETTVVNWDPATDAKILLEAGNASQWTAQTVGGNTVLTRGDQDLTVEGVTGLGVTDILEFL